MLMKRDLSDCEALFNLLVHPDVFPFVRHRASSVEEYLFVTKQLIEAEEQGELISRTIIDEWGTPIGTITLFDIQNNAGFLGTWIGKPYHGMGYNEKAKSVFFDELFFSGNIERIYMKVRNTNERSRKAVLKLPYVQEVSATHPILVSQINKGAHQYDLFEISKDMYSLHMMRTAAEEPLVLANEA
ncbi:MULTISPECIES: GNAT family N-acetyltransferase [Alteribacter]|uniref:N-acetyltransferase n=1 Tax=Alteribacter keqinensis TaxID=2483800 RepID=A0A3M7TX18_9BACI|nr:MULTISPECIES: GNAT family protein [Alteribacter]MBM7094456.1 GNAT family N-acetyltransferase [Alteribacter salitolerans]RNA69324.1 N-acetyltransferase [Alteribacter keqinensis]